MKVNRFAVTQPLFTAAMLEKLVGMYEAKMDSENSISELAAHQKVLSILQKTFPEGCKHHLYDYLMSELPAQIKFLEKKVQPPHAY